MSQFDFVNLGPEIGAPTFIEFVVVTRYEYETPYGNTPCTTACLTATGFNYHRDIIDPARIETVLDIVHQFGITDYEYRVFSRNYRTGVLTEIGTDTALETKASVVFIVADASDAEITRITAALTSGNILPSRMTWP